MKLKLLVIAALVVAGGAAIFVSVGGGLPFAGNANATQYLTAAASTGDVTDSVAATGTIAAKSGYDLGFGAAPVLTTDSSATAGTGTWSVTEVSAQVGKAVKAGEVLAKASTADLQEQLAVAQSTLQSATIQLRQANKALTNASGTDAIRQARIGRLNALNGKRQAQQSVDDLHKQISYAVLKAPIDGVVTAVNIAKGLDSTGTAISISSSAYEVTADVVETDISSMTVGQDATIAVDAIGASIAGKVTSIAPTSSTSSGSSSVVSYPVTVSLTGAPPTLRAGMTADITIVTASATNVLTVPAAALRGTTRQLPGPGHGRRRHPDPEAGHRGPGHQHAGGDQDRARRGRHRRHRDARRTASRAATARPTGSAAAAVARSVAAASSSTVAAGSSRDHGAADHQPARHQPHLRPWAT